MSKVTIEDFPYYKDYVSTVDAEFSISGGGNILFVGGGPVPISAILLNMRHGASVDVLELLDEAVQIARNLIKFLDLNAVSIMQGDGSSFNDYGQCDIIYIALEAGDTEARKKAIFHKIANSDGLTKNTVILIRGSADSNFIKVDDFIQEYFVLVDKIPVFSGFSVTYILHCICKNL